MLFPVCVSSNSFPHTIHLLRLHKNEIRHFVLIKSLGPMLAHYNHSRRQNYVCERCLYVTVCLEIYKAHIELCQNHKVQRTLVPKFNDTASKDKLCYLPASLEPNVTHYKAVLSFFATADLESLLSPVSNSVHGVQNVHIPISAVYKICSTDANFYAAPRIFLGSNVMEQFLDHLQMEASKIQKILMNPATLSVSPEQRLELENESHYHLCKKLILPEETWVIDHNHLTSVICGNFF